MSSESIHTGHRERLRQRLMTFGADALCEHELLELILFYAIPRINTNDIAHCLVSEFGTVNNILNAEHSKLEKVKGVGSSTADYFENAAPDLCLLLSLNNDLTVAERTSFSASSIMSGNSEIKRIAASLLRSGCSRIALGITHPDRPPVPDEDDFAIARFIAERLEPIGIILEDCVICGGKKSFSMKQSGAFSFRR